MKRVAAKFVPRLLSEDQRANCLDVYMKWKINWKLIQTFCPKSSQEMNLRSGDKATIKSMENGIIPKTKKGEAS